MASATHTLTIKASNAARAIAKAAQEAGLDEVTVNAGSDAFGSVEQAAAFGLALSEIAENLSVVLVKRAGGRDDEGGEIARFMNGAALAL